MAPLATPDAMPRLPASLRAWGSDAFAATLKHELESLPTDALPLRDALRIGSHVLTGSHGVRLLSASEHAGVLRVRIGLFFSSVIAGCSCADDPTPIEPIAEYCECLVEIDRADARARVMLVDDGSAGIRWPDAHPR